MEPSTRRPSLEQPSSSVPLTRDERHQFQLFGRTPSAPARRRSPLKPLRRTTIEDGTNLDALPAISSSSSSSSTSVSRNPRSSVFWKPQLTEVWVRQPGIADLVFGWYRESAHPYADTLFLSNGDVQSMPYSELNVILATVDDPEQAMSDPRSIVLHPLLHPAVKQALTTREFMTENENDPDQPYSPVITR